MLAGVRKRLLQTAMHVFEHLLMFRHRDLAQHRDHLDGGIDTDIAGRRPCGSHRQWELFFGALGHGATLPEQARVEDAPLAFLSGFDERTPVRAPSAVPARR